MTTFGEYRNQPENAGRFDDWQIDDLTEMADLWKSLPYKQLIKIATNEGVLTDKELRLLAVYAVRQVEYLLCYDETRHAIDVAEKFANGEASIEELTAAHEDADKTPWQNLAATNAVKNASDPISGLCWTVPTAVSSAANAFASDTVAAYTNAMKSAPSGDAGAIAANAARKQNRQVFEQRLLDWIRNNTSPNFDAVRS